MREEQSENKMNRIDEYKYHVVKFLESPFKDTERVSCEDVCVPKSWIKWCSPEDNIVKVWYPTQDPRNTETKVRKREKKSDQWESFLCVLKYSTDIYEEAKMYIRNKKYSENDHEEDHTPLSATMEERPCKTTSSAIQNEATVENMLDTIGWSISSKSANTITLKRKAPADSDKTTHKKRSKVNETGKSDDKVAGLSGQALKNQTLTHKGSNEDLRIQKTPVVKSNKRNSTKKKKIVKQKASKGNHSLVLKSVVQLPIFAECCKLILELQKYLGNSLPKEIFNKLMNTDNSRSALTDDTIASASSVITVQAPKLNEEKRNEEQTEENDSDDDAYDDDRDEDDHVDDDCDDDDDMNEHTKTKNNRFPIIKKVVPPKDDANYSDDDDCDGDDCGDDDRDEDDCGDDEDNCDDCQTGTKQDKKRSVLPKTGQRPRRLKTFVLPPKYDADDSRWTLKYCKPAPGIVELVENSGVYVRATSLENCLRVAKHGYDLSRRLLSAVFTASALRTCSWTGQRPPGSYYSHGTNARPGLDAHAREVLLNFVISAVEEGSSDSLDQYRKELKTSMYSYMVAMRAKTSK